jgi:hypothetical protein
MAEGMLFMIPAPGCQRVWPVEEMLLVARRLDPHSKFTMDIVEKSWRVGEDPLSFVPLATKKIKDLRHITKNDPN